MLITSVCTLIILISMAYNDDKELIRYHSTGLVGTPTPRVRKMMTDLEGVACLNTPEKDFHTR